MADAKRKGWRRCYLCLVVKVVKEFTEWKIIENEYPYDKIADIHHIVTLKRHNPEKMLTIQEKIEFEKEVKLYLHRNYDMIFENTAKTRSIPWHHHMHMITLKHLPQIHTQVTHQTEFSLPLETLQR